MASTWGFRAESDYWYLDDTTTVRHDLIAIRDELCCNAVNVYGRDIPKLLDTARVALELGLEVWLQPRLPDAPWTSTRSPDRMLALRRK